MPRKTAPKEGEQYVTLPTLHWKEYLKESSQAVILKDFVPNRQMLLPGGYSHSRYKEGKDGQQSTLQQIIFDGEYINYYFHYRLLEPIGWFASGTVDRTGFSNFLETQYAYSESIPRQAFLEGIKEEAARLALSFPHKTAEQWEAELLGSTSTATPSTNGNVKQTKETAKVK